MAEHEPTEFSTAFRGYNPEEVDTHLEACREREAELEAQVHELTADRRRLERELDRLTADRDRLSEDNARLDRDLARIQGELDATRAALPEIEDLQHRLEGLTADYERRVRALDLLLPYAIREAGEGMKATAIIDADEPKRSEQEAGEEAAEQPSEEGPDVPATDDGDVPAPPTDASEAPDEAIGSGVTVRGDWTGEGQSNEHGEGVPDNDSENTES